MPGAVRTQQRADARRNREAILDAAARVLSQKRSPTLIEIASAAGISRATIYRHFSDVEAIREELLAEVHELSRDLLRTHLAEGLQSGEPFPVWVTKLMREGLPIRTRYAEALAKEPKQDEGSIAMFQPVFKALIRQSQQRGEMRADRDAGLMAEALIAVGFYAARRIYRDGVPVEDAMQLFETFIDGMAPQPRRI